jgi:hypothetical protein
MATEQAAQWAEPSGRDSMAVIAENTLQAAATAIEHVDVGMTARRITSRALGWSTRAARTTSSVTRSTLRGVRALAQRSRERGDRARRTLAPALPWISAGGASWLVYASTQSWSQAAIAGTCLFALTTLSAMRTTQRLEALALHKQLVELRLSLRVTQALLDVEMIEDAEHIEDELDDTRESGTRRLPRQRVSRPQLG